MKFFKRLCFPDYTPFNSPLGACHRLLSCAGNCKWLGATFYEFPPKFTGRCFQSSLRNKGPFKVPFKRLFFFLRLRLSWILDKMENLWECSSLLRRRSGKCWKLPAFFFGVEAILRGFPGRVWLCRNHATKVKVKIRSKANCCFPSIRQVFKQLQLGALSPEDSEDTNGTEELKITEQVKRYLWERDESFT